MKNNKFLWILMLLFAASPFLQAQEENCEEETEQSLDEIIENSQVLTFEVIDGDTITFVNLPTVAFTSRKFKDNDERRRYERMRRRIIKVYPYAKKASELMGEIETETARINKKRHQKKYLKSLEKELKTEFEDRLKNLTVSQGKILVKLVERNTGKNMNNIIKNYKSPVTAFVWTQASKAYGYDLKKGYDPDDTDFEFLEEIVRAIEANGGEAAEGFGL